MKVKSMAMTPEDVDMLIDALQALNPDTRAAKARAGYLALSLGTFRNRHIVVVTHGLMVGKAEDEG